MLDNQDYFKANKAIWDEKTKHHSNSGFYNVPAFLQGKTSLSDIEMEYLKDVKGKKVMHLQCHFGLDTLSIARLGAQATGIDLSSESIKLAKELNEQLGLDVQFHECNVYDTEQFVNEKYDLIFCSYGALVWLPDLEKWTAMVDRLLKPNGRCLIVEFHPYIHTFDYPNTDIKFNYCNAGKPYMESSAESYTDSSKHKAMKEFFWTHSLEEVMAGFIQRDYDFLAFREYYYSPYDCFGNSKEIEPGKWVFGGFEAKIPHVYALYLQKKDI